MSDDPFRSRSAPGTTSMNVGGLTCQFHMPDAPKTRIGEDGEEEALGLPPSALRTAFSVDEFNRVCPEGWMRGGTHSSGYPVSSYFSGVRPGKAMWFNLNELFGNTHDVAVLISMRGVNPIDAMPFEFRLRQYRNNCPKHAIPFGGERFCKECNYKWPDQNYLATTGTPYGLLWLDGYRQPNGVVRNFLFTEDMERDVAHQLGIKDPPQAFGLAFYLSKEPKRARVTRPTRGGGGYLGGGGGLESFGGATLGYDEPVRGATRSARPMTKGGSSREIGVAAGARIKQQVYLDPKDVDYWSETPAGVIYFNYVSEDACQGIIAAGRPDLEQHREGPLAGLKVGNPGTSHQA